MAVTKSISIPFTFDELNDENVRKFVMGKSVTASKSIVMDKDNFEGRAILNFQTDVGNNFIYVIPSCSLKSDGGLAFNAEDWMNGNFSLEVLHNSVYREGGSQAASLAPYGYLNFDQLGRTTLQNVVENWVNCWKLLTNKLRQSAAKLTEKVIEVGKKVQRLTDEDTLPITLTRAPSIS